MPLGQFVSGMVGESGVVDAFHLGMLGQELGNLLRVGALRGHAEVEGVNAPQDQPGVERAHDPAKIAEDVQVEMIDIIPGADHGASHRVTVPAQVLGGGVDHDRNTQLEGLLKDR